MINSKTLKNEGKLFSILNIILLGLLSVIAIFPFYNVFIVSLAKIEVIVKQPVYIIPLSFDLTSYKQIVMEPKFVNAMLVSIFVTVSGVCLSMLLSVLGAYALSKKNMPGRNFLLAAILFTMFFNGGLIPYYLVVKNAGLINNVLCMVIPPAINTFYLIIMKNYFTTIPASLEESARIDGANDIFILIRIIIPTSAPFIATFALFYSVDRWNEWWNALMFINESKKAPLQIFLREILINFSNQFSTMAEALRDRNKTTYLKGIQMAAVVVSSIPILLVYPYLQKHFVKGILVGALKE